MTSTGGLTGCDAISDASIVASACSSTVFESSFHVNTWLTLIYKAYATLLLVVVDSSNFIIYPGMYLPELCFIVAVVLTYTGMYLPELCFIVAHCPHTHTHTLSQHNKQTHKCLYIPFPLPKVGWTTS